MDSQDLFSIEYLLQKSSDTPNYGIVIGTLHAAQRELQTVLTRKEKSECIEISLKPEDLNKILRHLSMRGVVNFGTVKISFDTRYFVNVKLVKRALWQTLQYLERGTPFKND